MDAKAKEVVSTVASTVMPSTTTGPTKTAGTKVEVMTDMLKEYWIIILILIIIIIIVLIVVFIIRLVKSNTDKDFALQKDIIVLNDKNVVPYITSEGVDNISNGQEFSVAFWIFLGANYQSTNGFKHVFSRGNTATTPNMFAYDTSPLFMLDSSTNKMYIGVSTTLATVANNGAGVFEMTAAGKYTSKYLATYIDYLPLQRWVFITMVVKDNNMIIYIDGDIYSTVNIADVSEPGTPRATIRGNKGDVVIGDKGNMTNGYMSKTTMYNNALTQKEIYALYKKGPIKTSWLAFIGLGNYGVRAPVYKIS